jgi:hypothetical protein
MKVAPRFELGMEALQASALPLGDATLRKIKKHQYSDLSFFFARVDFQEFI